MKEGFVYILTSPNCERYYIGSTEKLERRLVEHNSNLVTATRGKGPWTICFRQKYEDIKIARKVEIKLKRFKSRVILEKIISDGGIKLKSGD